MKQKSKESIEWIKSVLNDCKINVNNSQSLDNEEKVQRYANIENALKFLDSLPDIESHLCRGGYIQDKNGTPCCDGDIIRIIVPEGNAMTGRLCWSDTDKNFSIRNAQKRQTAYFVHNLVFEKV